MTALDVLSGVRLWNGLLDRAAQQALLSEILRGVETAPFYRPVMPKSAQPFRVEETNFGPLGWVSDRAGYRYQTRHPQTGEPWPSMPISVADLWQQCTAYPSPAQCCLVNLYRAGARMGLHQDRDEADLDAPVLSISLGDDAQFRIGGASRRSPTRTIRLRSGDVLLFGGQARLAFHGIDKIFPGTSTLVPGGGRINLTLRWVEWERRPRK